MASAKKQVNKGGARPGSGRKKLNKVNKTYSIDKDISDKKPTSKIVNDLLKSYYGSK